MADLTCVDGSRLGVQPVPVLDRSELPYEVTLRLTRDGGYFGAVGERCGYFVATLHSRLAAARADGSPESARWGLPDRFPASSTEHAVRLWALESGRDGSGSWSELARYLPRDRELFSFRRRDPDDLASAGELRCLVQTEKSWVSAGGETVSPAAGLPGRWRLARRAVLDAWGEGGHGVRAVLDSTELACFLGQLVDEIAATASAVADAVTLSPQYTA